MTTKTVEEIVEDMLLPLADPATFFKNELRDLLVTTLTTRDAQIREEERAFILNVLDGIDIADEEMGNAGGGTQAIRKILDARVI